MKTDSAFRQFLAGILAASLLLVFSLGLLCAPGCTTTAGGKSTLSPVVAQIAVQYGVMKVVEKNPAYGPRIVQIAQSVKEAAKGNVSATVATIDALIRSQIHWEKLSPADTQLVELTLSAIEAELEARVGAGVLAPDKLLVVSQVAGWISDAATAASQPSGKSGPALDLSVEVPVR